MLTQEPRAGPWLRCRRHAALLAAAIVGIAGARCSGTPLAPIALAFAGYGALHAVALGLSLHPRPAGVRVLGFAAAASLQCGLLARVGLMVLPLLARSGVAAAFIVAAVCAFAGALGYGGLLRWLLGLRLARGRLVMIGFACVVAVSAALLLMRQYPPGGSAWLAILWWIAFSGGLCGARRMRLQHAPPDATTQRMP